ncbi:MAG: hypothetical protein C7B43_09760 [Sulfobacillus benefaciens]|uniref:Uncharacterized protein n=1 Tax=Sulfobacillus benefaciens TaxID=453960 RepID=A0A2T2X2I6_9FIRM|nr:MAG: hypothetical protein C7B43_09760 [Sulfobacillus benefaciens]
MKHQAFPINEYAVWMLLHEYYPQCAEDSLVFEAHQIAQELELALFDRIRCRNRHAHIIVS